MFIWCFFWISGNTKNKELIVNQCCFSSFEADCDELSKKVFGRVAAQVCGQWSPNATRLDYRCAKLGGNSALPPYFQMGSLSQLRYAAVCLSMWWDSLVLFFSLCPGQQKLTESSESIPGKSDSRNATWLGWYWFYSVSAFDEKPWAWCSWAKLSPLTHHKS